MKWPWISRKKVADALENEAELLRMEISELEKSIDRRRNSTESMQYLSGFHDAKQDALHRIRSIANETGL